MVMRLATVRWHLPSRVSGAGETVAALAAHIAEADQAAARTCGSASSTVVPNFASQALSGRSWGRKRPWVSPRSEEHTSELQSLMRISYAVFCLKKKNHKHKQPTRHHIS